VLEDVSDTDVREKEADMDKQKPLKDWTLEETKEYCLRQSSCFTGCRLYVMNRAACVMSKPVSLWDLTEKPRFTEEEVKQAENLFAAFGDGLIGKLSTGGIIFATVPKGAFPSIQNGQHFKLSEILKGVDP
ncbi:MAG: hypothetical protein J6V15_02665, partial [Clostridia bacterium]|nr:hypothetical protein [Clostridia bacterium]